MIVAALQLPNIGMSTTKLYHYVRIANKRGVRVLLLGEYLLNAFFKELGDTPMPMIAELFERQLTILKDLSEVYDITLVAPMIRIEEERPYKIVAQVTAESVSYYHQQFLIDYSHWNEAAFFANPVAPVVSPMIFEQDGVRFGILGGFELHFDPLWDFVRTERIDCMLLPTASTFDSQPRWRDLISMRAFTHHCYILRSNRIGEYTEAEHRWRFYGDSLLADPEGGIENYLTDSEELMVAKIDPMRVREARRNWRFDEALERRRG